MKQSEHLGIGQFSVQPHDSTKGPNAAGDQGTLILRRQGRMHFEGIPGEQLPGWDRTACDFLTFGWVLLRGHRSDGSHMGSLFQMPDCVRIAGWWF